MRTLVDKLTDKGFNGGEIHLFMVRFGLNAIWIEDPRCYIDTNSEHYKKGVAERAARERAKWDEANIAADFERPR